MFIPHDAEEHEAVGAENLFRGSRWPRALVKVNRDLLIPSELRDRGGHTTLRLVSDREHARSCELPVIVTAHAGRAVERIEIPAHARAVPGSVARPGHRPLLFAAAQDSG